MITKYMINKKNPISYDVMKTLEKNSYLKGYRAGRRFRLEKPTVTREWIENLVSDLNASYIGYHGSKPGYKVIGDALHSLGVTVEKSTGS